MTTIRNFHFHSLPRHFVRRSASVSRCLSHNKSRRAIVKLDVSGNIFDFNFWSVEMKVQNYIVLDLGTLLGGNRYSPYNPYRPYYPMGGAGGYPGGYPMGGGGGYGKFNLLFKIENRIKVNCINLI